MGLGDRPPPPDGKPGLRGEPPGFLGAGARTRQLTRKSALPPPCAAEPVLKGKSPSPYLDRSELDIDLLQKQLLKKNIAYAATAFVLSHEAVKTAVIGLRTEQQLLDLIPMGSSSLDEVNLTWLRECFSENDYLSHL